MSTNDDYISEARHRATINLIASIVSLVAWILAAISIAYRNREPAPEPEAIESEGL